MCDLTFLEYAAIVTIKLLPAILLSVAIVGIITIIDNYTEKKEKEKEQKKAASIQRQKEIEAARKKMFDMLKNI